MDIDVDCKKSEINDFWYLRREIKTGGEKVGFVWVPQTWHCNPARQNASSISSSVLTFYHSNPSVVLFLWLLHNSLLTGIPLLQTPCNPCLSHYLSKLYTATLILHDSGWFFLKTYVFVWQQEFPVILQVRILINKF